MDFVRGQCIHIYVLLWGGVALDPPWSLPLDYCIYTFVDTPKCEVHNYQIIIWYIDYRSIDESESKMFCNWLARSVAGFAVAPLLAGVGYFGENDSAFPRQRLKLGVHLVIILTSRVRPRQRRQHLSHSSWAFGFGIEVCDHCSVLLAGHCCFPR